MNLAGVDLNLFVVFDTIYAERSLTRASEILHVTQPAVSNALARLRENFDDPLFVRVGRVMTPSPLAQNLVGPVRDALRQLRTTIDGGRRFDPLRSDKAFALSLRDNAGTQLIPALLARLQRVAPDVRVQCPPVERRDIAAELASGQLDFAIDIPELARSEMKSIRLLRDDYVCVMRKRHPLVRGTLTLDRFLSAKHVQVSSRRSGRGHIDLALARTGHAVTSALRVTQFQLAFHTVAQTDLLLSAPLSLARRYDVVVKPLPFAAPALEAMLYWHRNADLDPANVWMREQIVAASGKDALKRSS